MIPNLLTAPALEPVSLDEAKAWLRLDSTDEDPLLAALIVSARLTLESYTRRLFVTQSWRMRLDAWPAQTLRRGTLAIPFSPFRSLSAIRVYDAADVAQTLASATYRAAPTRDAGRIAFVSSPPEPGRACDGIEIDLVTGYGDSAIDTPEPLRRAILALVAHWHENRGDVGDAGGAIANDRRSFGEALSTRAFDMSAPKIGELRSRMSLEAPVDAPDDSGGMTRSYVTLANIWVKLIPLSAEARFVEQRQELAIQWIAQARWRGDVTSEMRLVDGARRLRVTSAYDPDGRRRFLLCHCEEIA